MTGIHARLRRGSEVSLSRFDRPEKFTIAWVGKENTSDADQIGVTSIDPTTSFWDDVIEDSSEPTSVDYESANIREKPKARAHGAWKPARPITVHVR